MEELLRVKSKDCAFVALFKPSLCTEALDKCSSQREAAALQGSSVFRVLPGDTTLDCDGAGNLKSQFFSEPQSHAEFAYIIKNLFKFELDISEVPGNT